MVMSEETVLTDRVLCCEDDDGRWTMLIAGLVGTEGIKLSTGLGWEALGVRLPVRVVYRDIVDCISVEDMVPKPIIIPGGTGADISITSSKVVGTPSDAEARDILPVENVGETMAE